eukprot:gene14087-biopygen23093
MPHISHLPARCTRSARLGRPTWSDRLGRPAQPGRPGWEGTPPPPPGGLAGYICLAPGRPGTLYNWWATYPVSLAAAVRDWAFDAGKKRQRARTGRGPHG